MRVKFHEADLVWLDAMERSIDRTLQRRYPRDPKGLYDIEVRMAPVTPDKIRELVRRFQGAGWYVVANGPQLTFSAGGR